MSDETVVTEPAQATPDAEPEQATSLVTGTETEATSPEPAQEPVQEAAPVEYTFTAPEGVTLDQTVLDKFVPLAREMNIPPEKAQAIVDLGLEMQRQWDAQAQQQHAAQRKAWADEIRSDPELGGAKFEQTVSKVQETFRRYASPEAAQFLIDSGLGDHPALVRMFHTISTRIKEDTPVQGSAPASGISTARAQAMQMYPNSPELWPKS